MIGCIVMNEFPAVALQRMRYRRSDVAVVHRERIVARTATLQQRGLALGEAVHRARVLFPNAVFTQRDTHVEYAAWADIMEQCHGVSPYIEALHAGIALLDVDHHQPLLDLAHSLNAQAGLAPTRTVAVLAALRAGIGTLRIVSTETMAAFLAEWPVQLLAQLHVSNDSISKLGLFGLTTMANLQMLTRRQLEAQFGNDGTTIHAIVASIAARTRIPLYQPPPVVDQTTYLDPPEREPEALGRVLHHITDIALERLNGLLLGQLDVHVRVRQPAGIVRASRLLRSPTNAASHVHTVANILLRDVVGPQHYCSSIGVTLRLLQAPVPHQLGLFLPTPNAADVAASISRRYPQAIRRVDLHTADAYLPELAYTLVPWPTPHASDS